MSKFFVTNNRDWYNKLKNNIKESQFKIIGDYLDDNIYAISTKKLQIDNENFYQEKSNFIIQTGTCIYKENSGTLALKKALTDFIGNVQTHREEYIGNFGCFIKKGDSMVAFNEGTGFYDIFYYHQDKEWIIGTSIIDISKILSDRITIDKLNVLEELTRFAIFNNETYFTEIKRLSGDQYLKVDDCSLNVFPLDLNIIVENPTDYDTRAKKIAKEMKYIASVMYKNFGQTTLGCTGGFDSRMVLAAYLAAGIKPKIAYGYGHSNLAPSMKGDVDVNIAFRDRYNLELEIAPWNETEPVDKLWDQYIEKYGELIYDGCEDAYNFYTNPNERFLSFGYTGEIYREADWSKDIANDKMTLEDYLWKNHAICNTNIIEHKREIVNHWLNKWRKLNENHSINKNKFHKRDLFWLNIAYRSSADNHMVNLINQFKYAHYLMSDIRIIRNGYVDFEKKYNGRYMINILNELYPDILNIPFFTHCHWMHYNPQEMQIEEVKKNTIRKKIGKILPQIIKKKIIQLCIRKDTNHIFSNAAFDLLLKDNNKEKLCRLVGKDVLNIIEHNDYNMMFVIRGILLCKTFDYIGIDY